MKKEKIVLLVVIFILVVSILFYFYRSSNSGENPINNSTLCAATTRPAGACIQIYQPVCGWFNPDKIQCIKYPCAQTFSNSCEACMDSKVISYTEGECPSG